MQPWILWHPYLYLALSCTFPLLFLFLASYLFYLRLFFPLVHLFMGFSAYLASPISSSPLPPSMVSSLHIRSFLLEFFLLCLFLCYVYTASLRYYSPFLFSLLVSPVPLISHDSLSFFLLLPSFLFLSSASLLFHVISFTTSSPPSCTAPFFIETPHVRLQNLGCMVIVSYKTPFMSLHLHNALKDTNESSYFHFCYLLPFVCYLLLFRLL